MCHPVAMTGADLKLSLDEQRVAVRIEAASSNSDLEVVAYENPNKTMSIIVYNSSDNTHVIENPLDKNQIIKIYPHTIYTVI